jgi:negative regulator of flagellin synthesis FlgM
MVKVNIDNLQGKDAVRNTRNERAEKTAGSAPVKETKGSLENDKIEFSGKGAEVGKLVEELKQLPDTRQGRVNELKQKIASGEYQPSNEDIADAILKDE